MTATAPAHPQALLARYAEGLFWMARYLERAECVARVLDVTQTFEASGRPAQAWESVVRINADEEEFARRYGQATPEAVRRFYLLDHDNATSIPASVAAARQNARTLRPLISTEMWTQLNMFHGWMSELTEDDVAGDGLPRLCARIKESVQLHAGITEGTFYRDQGWHFLQLGHLIERADQTTRLLDIKYHLLLPSLADIGSALDLSQWHALLRAAAGYHAFRRVHSRGLTPQAVADLLLLNGSFPRSVLLCVRQAEWSLEQLRSEYGLSLTEDAARRVVELRAGLEGRGIDHIIEGGLHEFLDRVQRLLIAIAGAIGAAFFRDWRPDPASSDPAVPGSAPSGPAPARKG